MKRSAGLGGAEEGGREARPEAGGEGHQGHGERSLLQLLFCYQVL